MQGFAWGMGIDRIAMLKYGMPDLRAFFEADVRWLAHYGFRPLDFPTLGGRAEPVKTSQRHTLHLPRLRGRSDREAVRDGRVTAAHPLYRKVHRSHANRCPTR